MAYHLDRLDTMGRDKRDALLAEMPGWEFDPNRPQFFLVDEGDLPADWHLMSDRDEAFRTLREFNTADDDLDRSEARGLARMAGDLD